MIRERPWSVYMTSSTNTQLKISEERQNVSCPEMIIKEAYLTFLAVVLVMFGIVFLVRVVRVVAVVCRDADLLDEAFSLLLVHQGDVLQQEQLLLMVFLVYRVCLNSNIFLTLKMKRFSRLFVGAFLRKICLKQRVYDGILEI